MTTIRPTSRFRSGDADRRTDGTAGTLSIVGSNAFLRLHGEPMSPESISPAALPRRGGRRGLARAVFGACAHFRSDSYASSAAAGSTNTSLDSPQTCPRHPPRSMRLRPTNDDQIRGCADLSRGGFLLERSECEECSYCRGLCSDLDNERMEAGGIEPRNSPRLAPEGNSATAGVGRSVLSRRRSPWACRSDIRT